MGIRDEKAIREALSIPENELLGAVIAVGYRAINPDKPKRKTVDVSKTVLNPAHPCEDVRGTFQVGIQRTGKTAC